MFGRFINSVPMTSSKHEISCKRPKVPHIRYRYPTEWWIFGITVMILTFGIIALNQFNFISFIFFFLLICVLNSVAILLTLEGFKRNSVEVTLTQFPEVYALVEECRQYIDIPVDTRVFITYSPIMNAFAMGLGRPYAIMLTSALVESFDEDELRYVISHEMGHIKFWHTILLTLIGTLGNQTYGIPVIRELFYLSFLWWSRAAESTADRAGLVGSGRLDKSISAQAKFGAGPVLAQTINWDALVKQARETHNSMLGGFIEMVGTHPTMVVRIQRLVQFADSDTFRRLRPDVQPFNTAETSPTTQAGQSKRVSPPSGRFTIRRLDHKNQQLTDQNGEQGQVDLSQPLRPKLNSPAPNSLLDPPTPKPSPSTSNGQTQGASPVDWAQHVSLQRLGVSAIRANAEQAEVWLQMGELLQDSAQTDQAETCLQRAQSLLDNANLPVLAGRSSIVTPVKTHTRPEQSCYHCQQAIPHDAHFCPHCQTQLDKPCLNCGAYMQGQYTYCAACGEEQPNLLHKYQVEIETLNETVNKSLPPNGLTRTEKGICLVIFIQIPILLIALARIVQVHELLEEPYQIALLGAAWLIPWLWFIACVVWAEIRGKRHWKAIDKFNFAARRYNQLAELLIRQNIRLTPQHVPLQDPWQQL
ncbi:M48 family metallopeptidase [Anaerolineales bacterium HSG24]|nr:M48 family metallopeptidase [Anaerolineales bacterium HSG24]